MHSSAFPTLIEAFEVHQHQTRKGIFYLNRQLDIQEFCSFQELFRRARSIQALLEHLNVKSKGGIVLLVYDQGIEFLAAMLGCFMANVIAVPCYPPVSKPTISRMINIIKNIKPALVFVDATTHHLMKLSKFFDYSLVKSLTNWWISKQNQLPNLEEACFNYEVVETDSKKETSFSLSSSKPDPEDVAFLQYTSGSIGHPKGVIIKHKNLTSNLNSIKNRMKIDDESRIFSWLPQYHDMGLVGCLLMAVYAGCDIYLTSPINFVRSPLIWLKGISKYRITHTAAPNFAYELCIYRGSDEEKKNLDLASLVANVNGAEPIRQNTLERFKESFASAHYNIEAMSPCYGLAEATLLVSVNHESHCLYQNFHQTELQQHRAMLAEDGMAIVNCGPVIAGSELCILSMETKEILPEGFVGEIWLTGESVSEGYWGKENSDRLYLKEDTTHFFNTGDLGFLFEGNLYVTGRSSEMIIKNGLNYYPQDIEMIVEAHHAFVKRGRCVAFSYQNEDKEQVAVVFEYSSKAEKKLDPNELKQIKLKVMENLGLHVDHVLAVSPNTIQKTTSGKLQRKLLKSWYEEGQLEPLLESA